jgi:hypothetical protein
MRKTIFTLVALALAVPAAAATTPFDFSGTEFSPDAVREALQKASGGSAGASASSGGTGGGGVPAGIVEQVSTRMIPSVPKPGDLVSIRVDSYSTDLNKAYVTWTQDGAVASEGVGVVNFYFSAPEAGQRTVIEMAAAKQGGGTVRKTFTVSPADLDLTYEAKTYTPPFYDGRAEFTNSSLVRVVSLPNFVNPDTGEEISPENLVYTWRVDGTVDQSISGYGRSAADIRGELVSRGLEIEVEAEALDVDLEARAAILIKDTRPELAVYERHPLYGVVFEQALGESPYPVNEEEISLVAVPYSMDIASLSDPRVEWNWRTSQGKGPGTPVVTFRPEPGAAGLADASIRINHQNFAQYVSGAVKLEFKPVTLSTTTPF